MISEVHVFCAISELTYSLSVEGILKVTQPPLLVLMLPENAVVADHFLLVAGLQQLHSDAAFLLRLTHQPVDHHLFTAGLLLGQKHMR